MCEKIIWHNWMTKHISVRTFWIRVCSQRQNVSAEGIVNLTKNILKSNIVFYLYINHKFIYDGYHTVKTVTM